MKLSERMIFALVIFLAIGFGVWQWSKANRLETAKEAKQIIVDKKDKAQKKEVLTPDENAALNVSTCDGQKTFKKECADYCAYLKTKTCVADFILETSVCKTAKNAANEKTCVNSVLTANGIKVVDASVGRPGKNGRTVHQKLDRIDTKVGNVGTNLNKHRKATEPGLGKVPNPKGPKHGGGAPADKTADKCIGSEQYGSLFIPYSTDPKHCEAIRKTVAYGAACFPNPVKKAFLAQNSNICMSHMKKLGAKIERNFRAMGGNKVKCGVGTDLNNGFESCEGSNPFMVAEGGLFLAGVGKFAYENGVPSKLQDKWGGRNPVTGGGGGTVKGPNDPNGPTDDSDLTGPSHYGDNTNAGTLPGHDINVKAGDLPVDSDKTGKGFGPQVFPKGTGSTYSGDGTISSDLNAKGYSAGTTDFSKLGENPF